MKIKAATMKWRLGQWCVSAVLVGSLGVAACTPAGEGVDTNLQEVTTAGQAGVKNREIEYRGQRRTATEVNGLLLLEGDIEVVAQDISAPDGEAPRSGEGLASRSQPLRQLGNSRSWAGANGAVIPFDFAGAEVDVDNDGVRDTFTQAERNFIVAAMTQWSDRVPGIRFRAAQSGDADRIRFQLDKGCSSPLGKVGGTQTVRLSRGCASTFATHHEIAHSLGINHEHSRHDRGSHINVVWGNIKGCRDGATSRADCGWASCVFNEEECGCDEDEDVFSCDESHNFEQRSDRANVHEYDFGSVMHYPATAFSKNGLATITGHGSNAIGQRTRLSDKDVRAMKALYPAPMVRDIYFANTGMQKMCSFIGREQDLATVYYLDEITRATLMMGTDGMLHTGQLQPNSDVHIWCGINSNFWGVGYEYPNTTVPHDPSAPTHLHAYGRTIKVLSPGLIPVLTGATL